MRCSSAIRGILLAVLLLGALPLPAAEIRWPAAELVLEQTTDLIRYMVAINGAERVDGEHLNMPEEVSRFYWQRDFRPAWLDRDGIFLEAGSLLQFLRRAAEEGLRAEDYPVAAIEQRLYGKVEDPLELAQLDLLLTDAFLHYSRNLYSGRLDPRGAGIDWYIPYTPYDATPALQSALAQHDVVTPLRAMVPPHEGYRRLRQALQRLQAVAATGGWPQVEAGPILRLGMRDGRVAQLRERLLRSGDLVAAGAVEAELYDRTLRRAVQRFQRRHGLADDGSAGETTLATLNVSVGERIEQVQANMERWRWLPRQDLPRYIMVNMAGFELQVIEQRQPVMSMRVIVGRDYRQTPVFASQMTSLVLNPHWYVPQTILREDILPELRRDPAHLQRLGLRLFSSLAGNGTEVDPATVDWQNVDSERFPYVLRQEPGPNNSLGSIKFLLPNRYGIFLHDTPHRELFRQTMRAFSSGCIRLEDPLALAEYVLADSSRWDRAALEEAIAGNKPASVALPEPLPVLLAYWTAWVDDGGELQLRDDIYGRDRRLFEVWHEQGKQVVAQRRPIP